MNKKLTICLVSFNGAQYLPACLNSIINQSFTDWELLLLDNGSSDNSFSMLDDFQTLYSDKVRLLPAQDKNIGFAGASNLLAQASSGEYIALVNQDTVLHKDYLRHLVEFMDRHARSGAVSGKILKLTGGQKASIIDTAGLFINTAFKVSEIGAGVEDNGQYNDIREVFGVSAALPVYRSSALAEVGFFDESFFSYKEDVDLAFRLRHRSWRAYRVGRAVAYHERGVASKNIKQRRSKWSKANYWSYRNHWSVLIKNVAGRDWLQYGVVILGYELVKFVYLLFFEIKTAFALKDIIKNLFRNIRQRAVIKPKSINRWINQNN